MKKIQDFCLQMGEENAFAVLARAEKLCAEGRSIINLGIGQPDFKTAPSIVEAACKALKDGHHGYTPGQGILPLREAIASNLELRHGVPFDPSRLLITPGGKATLFMAIMMFGGSGVDIVCPNPGFPIYQSMIEATGSRAVAYSLTESNEFSFSADDILSCITPQTRLLILSSPANPTGGVASDEETRQLVKGLEAWPDVVVLSDEVYGQIIYDGQKHLSMASFPELDDRLILLDSFSKTYAMTGWRLGYSYWPKDLTVYAYRLAMNSYSCVNTATQWAGIEALKDKDKARQTMMKAFTNRRQLVVEGLNSIAGLSCCTPKGAFFAFPSIKAFQRRSEEIAADLLQKAGVAIIAGTSFGSGGEGFIRLSYAASQEDLVEGLTRIKTYFESIKV